MDAAQRLWAVRQVVSGRAGWEKAARGGLWWGAIFAGVLGLGLGEPAAVEPPAPVAATPATPATPATTVVRSRKTDSAPGVASPQKSEASGAAGAERPFGPMGLWPSLPTGTSADALQESPLLLLLALALLPMALLLVTGFVKATVVLSILRAAIGLPQVPSNQVIALLAFVASAYAMAPTAWVVWERVAPTVPTGLGETTQEERVEAAPASSGKDGTHGEARGSPPAGAQPVADLHVLLEPVRAFVERNGDAREQDMLLDLARDVRETQDHGSPSVPEPDARSWGVLAPAFLLTELREAFTVGFVLYLPFVLLDLVVAHLLVGLGLHNMNATHVALPLKLLLFVMADGWFLVLRGLVLGYV